MCFRETCAAPPVSSSLLRLLLKHTLLISAARLTWRYSHDLVRLSHYKSDFGTRSSIMPGRRAKNDGPVIYFACVAGLIIYVGAKTRISLLPTVQFVKYVHVTTTIFAINEWSTNLTLF